MISEMTCPGISGKMPGLNLAQKDFLIKGGELNTMKILK
jgi:hypothetical protein